MDRSVYLALLRFLIRARISSFIAIIGITLAVTSIVSVHLVSTQITQALERVVPAPLKQLDMLFVQDNLSAEHYFELRRKWQRGDHQNIGNMFPVVDEWIILNGNKIRVYGVDLFAVDLSQLSGASSSIADGTIDMGGVWIDPNLASIIGQITDAPVNGTLVGLSNSIVADISIAQALLGWREDKLSYVGVSLEKQSAAFSQLLENLLPGFEAGLGQPELVQVDAWQSVAFVDQYPQLQFGRSVLFNVSALSVLSLLVAWFLIYQIAVAWYRRLSFTFDRLFLVGVEKSVLQFAFISMLLLLGTIGCVAGLFLGEKLALWLLQDALGVDDIVLPQLDVWVLSKSFGSAFGVCLLGGWWVVSAHEVSNKSVTAIGAVLLLLFLWGVVDANTGLIGAFLSIAAVSFFMVMLVLPLLSYGRKRMRWVWPSGGLIAIGLREVSWYPKDLSIAICGLVLALATGIGVGIMVDSFRTDFSHFLKQRLSYDLSIENEVPAEILKFVQQNPLVERWQTYIDEPGRVDGRVVQLTRTRVDQIEAQRYGFHRGLEQDEVMVSQQWVKDTPVALGDAVVVANQSYRIAHVFQGYGDITPRIVIPYTGPQSNFSQVSSLSVNVANTAKFAADVSKHVGGHLQFSQAAQIRKLALDTFDNTFTITGVLISIAMSVAAIGLFVAVTTIRLNRRNSTTLLTSLGVNAWENLLVDMFRAIAIWLVCVLLAIPLGI